MQGLHWAPERGTLTTRPLKASCEGSPSSVWTAVQKWETRHGRAHVIMIVRIDT
jgi:hypothetical protein